MHLWARWTRPRVTKQQAVVSALRLELLPAWFPAGVRQYPRVKGRVGHLSAVALVTGGDLPGGVGMAALGAAPMHLALLPPAPPLALWRCRGEVWELVLLVALLLEDGVLGPALDARQVEGARTVAAAPDRVLLPVECKRGKIISVQIAGAEKSLLDGRYAYEARAAALLQRSQHGHSGPVSVKVVGAEQLVHQLGGASSTSSSWVVPLIL